MAKLDHGLFPRTDPAAAAEAERTCVLAVGNLSQWLAQSSRPPEHRQIAFANLEELNEATLAILEPAVVLSPVVATNFDCMDVATILARLNYRGAYRAVSQTLPNPDIVRREVRSLCPDLDFDIVTMGSEGFLQA